MTLLQAIILGIIQGVTEFLPISSSAHLVLFPHFLGWSFPQEIAFSFNVIVQLGTLTAVIIYYWSELFAIIKAFLSGIIKKDPFSEPRSRLAWLLALATLPGVLSGFFLKDAVEMVFGSPAMTAFFLFGTAFLIIVGEFIGKRNRTIESMKWLDAVFIGLFQAISIFPGISRSGSTITGAMMRNIKRQDASRFSFLMAIPIMLGAGAVSVIDLIKSQTLYTSLLPISIGFISAGITGFFAIRWLISFISRNNFLPFAIYCILLGAVTLGLSILNPQKFEQQKYDNPDYSVSVTFSPEIKPFITLAAPCNSTLNQGSIDLFSEADGYQSIITSDVVISYENIHETLPFHFKLGAENLVFAVSNLNPLKSLTKPLLVRILTGDLSKWGLLESECPECFEQSLDPVWEEKSIAVWIYNEGNIFQQILRKNLLGDAFASADAYISPGPEQMFQALSIDQAAIGFLPKSWQGIGLHTIQINEILDQMHVSIFASTHSMPSGLLQNWLLCVQNTFLAKQNKEG